MTPQEIIQAKVIAIQSVGPAGNIDNIRERFEFLVADEVGALVKKELMTAYTAGDLKNATTETL